MKFCLYGPAGCGKSTLIAKLQEAGLPAFDLEALPDTNSRELALQMADNCFLGGADTQPRARPDRCNILLYMEPVPYEARRRARDEQQPEKADQPAQTYDAWVEGPWNYVVNVQGDLHECVARIHAISMRPNIRCPPKPKKNLENWTQVVSGHADVVAGLMSWNAWVITCRGFAHDRDKVLAPNDSHMEQPHHWYDPSNDGTPDLVDLLESAADAAATTLGRYQADPWVLQWWYPPPQTAEWWEDVYSRAMAFDWKALDIQLPPNRVPGWRMSDAKTNQQRDD